MRAAFVTTYDAADPEAVNGSGFWAARCLRLASIEVDCLGPLETHRRYAIALKRRLYEHLLKQNYHKLRDIKLIRSYAREIERKLSAIDVDVVVSGMSLGSQPVAYLKTALPIVIWTDATFAAILEQGRENLRRLAHESRRDGLLNERAALARASLALYSSDWAARSAVEHYGLDPAKVHVVPYGPQLEIKHDAQDVDDMVAARATESCRLLLCGTKWHGKGADIAVDVARQLNARGLPTELDIVGCRPPDGPSLPDYVRLHGFLRKTVPQELETLTHLYRRAHLFLMPTRAEAFGIVYVEASAFGVPSLATNVGGVPTAVRDGVSGRLFPFEAAAGDYAAYILELLGDPSAYRELALSSYREYETRLAWPLIGARLRALLEGVVPQARPTSTRALF